MTSAQSEDLSEEAESSLLGLVERIHAQETYEGGLGLKYPPPYARQLAYTVVAIVESEIVGERVEHVFDRIKSSVGDVTVPYIIGYADEREENIRALSKDAFESYSQKASVEFSPVPSQILDRNRTLTQLVLEAQSRLEKASDHKFRSKQGLLYQ